MQNNYTARLNHEMAEMVEHASSMSKRFGAVQAWVFLANHRVSESKICGCF